MTIRTTIRARLTVTSAVLVVGAVTAACGGSGGGAPADASKDEFCTTQSSLFADLDLDVSDPEAELPSEKEMADAMHSWAEKMEDVGTPENISDEAREGFEETIKAAQDVTEDDLKSPDLNALENDMSEEAQKQVEAFTTYVNDTCGSMFGDLDVPEMQ